MANSLAPHFDFCYRFLIIISHVLVTHFNCHSRQSWGVTLIIAPYYPWRWASIRQALENKAAKCNSAILFHCLYLCLFNCDISKLFLNGFHFLLSWTHTTETNINLKISSHINDHFIQECVCRLTSENLFLLTLMASGFDCCRKSHGHGWEHYRVCRYGLMNYSMHVSVYISHTADIGTSVQLCVLFI